MLKHTKQQRIIVVAAAACVMVIEHLVIWQKPLFLSLLIYISESISHAIEKGGGGERENTVCTCACLFFPNKEGNNFLFSSGGYWDAARPVPASHKARGKRRVMVIAFFLSCSKGKQSKTEDPKWFFCSSLLVVLLWIPRLRTSLAHILRKKSRGGGFCPPSPAPKPLVNSPASASFWEERVYSLIRYSLPLAGLEREGEGKGLAGGGGS